MADSLQGKQFGRLGLGNPSGKELFFKGPDHCVLRRRVGNSSHAEGEPCPLTSQVFLKSVELLVELASLQTAFLTLDEAIKTTNRRVNALDNVVRPRLENTISYIKARCFFWPTRCLRSGGP